MHEEEWDGAGVYLNQGSPAPQGRGPLAIRWASVCTRACCLTCVSGGLGTCTRARSSSCTSRAAHACMCPPAAHANQAVTRMCVLARCSCSLVALSFPPSAANVGGTADLNPLVKPPKKTPKPKKNSFTEI